MLACFRLPRLKRSILSFLYGSISSLDVDGNGITYTNEGLNFPATLRLQRYDYAAPESMQVEIKTRRGLYKATIFPTSFGEIGVSLDGVLKIGRNKYEIRSTREKHRQRMAQNAEFLLSRPEFRENLRKALEERRIDKDWLGPKIMGYLGIDR